VPALLVEVTQAWVAAAAAKAARVAVVLAIEPSAQEVAAARCSDALRVKDAEDQATLGKREALERVSRVESENAVALAFACEDAKGFVQKNALLESELVVVHRAREVSERERREQFEELTLLQTWGSELCHAIIGPPWARNHLSEGMWHAALRHTKMAGELAALQAVVSSIAESALGHSLKDTFHMEVVGELGAKFQKLEERRSQLERPAVRICDLLLGPPPGRARLVDHLDEATGPLRVELAP
jgi:hypothetical protein